MANKEYNSSLLLKILPVFLLVMVFVSPLQAQVNYPSFHGGSLKITNTGMYILGSRALASIAVSPESVMVDLRINL